jgi:hypothetical protein
MAPDHNTCVMHFPFDRCTPLSCLEATSFFCWSFSHCVEDRSTVLVIVMGFIFCLISFLACALFSVTTNLRQYRFDWPLVACPRGRVSLFLMVNRFESVYLLYRRGQERVQYLSHRVKSLASNNNVLNCDEVPVHVQLLISRSLYNAIDDAL